MKKKHSGKTLLAGTGLLAVLWLIYFGSSLFLKHNDTPFDLLPPANAESVIQLDGRQLFNEALTVTFVSTKDDGISEFLFKRLNNADKRELRLGLDLLNEVVMFTDRYNDQLLKGFLFKINEPQLWDTHSPSLLDAHTHVMRFKNTAVVLQSSSLSSHELSGYASEHLGKTAYPLAKTVSRSPVHIRIQPSDSWLHALDAKAQIETNRVTFSGQVDVQPVPEQQRLRQALEPKGFHLTTDLIEGYEVYLSDFLPVDLGIPLEQISGFSLNYYGMDIVNGSNGILPLPNADLLLSAKTRLSPDSILAYVRKAYPKAILTDNSFQLHGITYYTYSFGHNALYIGRSSTPDISMRSGDTTVFMHGSLQPFTKIEGGRIMTAMIKMNSHYQHLADLSEKIAFIELSLTPSAHSDQTHFALSGTVEFRPEKSALVELLRVFLQSAPSP